jgi:hypothetical protein
MIDEIVLIITNIILIPLIIINKLPDIILIPLFVIDIIYIPLWIIGIYCAHIMTRGEIWNPK